LASATINDCTTWKSQPASASGSDRRWDLGPAGGKIEGLTTAASILVTAAIGLAAATGELRFAAALTAGVLGVLLALARVERWLGTAGPDPETSPDVASAAARPPHG
jgi:hypothetical protein